MIGKARFEKLLEPSQIGKVRTRNRMIKSAAWMAYGFGDKRNAFYETLARGGIGMIILESTAVDYPLGAGMPEQSRIDDDKFIPGFSKLTQAVHKHGCPIFLQLFHAGPTHGAGGAFSDLQPVSSSSLDLSEIPQNVMFDKFACRGLNIAEIGEYVNTFASAAERAQKAGFDGVDLSAQLIGSFISRFWNRRQDAYGCSNLESRARFLVEIIREIKKRVGQDFPVITSIGVEYGIDKGTTPEEAQGFARIIERAGADALSVGCIGFGEYFYIHFPDTIFYPEPPRPLATPLDGSRNGAGLLVPIAEGVKKAVSIPVITVGRLGPFLGEKILEQGRADFIALTRGLLADPELPNKVASGRPEDIAPCTVCAECLRFPGAPVRCRVNASLGSTQEYGIKPADKKKKVVVIGGGPTGMEAARVAALRGHEVILFEKEHILGGALPMAVLIKDTDVEDIPALIRYLKTQLKKLGVKIRLGKKFNVTVLDEIKPDVVIIAAGGLTTLPEISGVNKPNLASPDDLQRRLKPFLRFLGPRSLRWLTRLWMPIGKRVVVMGGSIQGCQLARFLVKRGRKVTIVDTARTMGEEIMEVRKDRLFTWLTEKGATMMTEARYEEITDEGLVITTKEGKRQTLAADSIVPAMPLAANTGLYKSLEGKVPEIYLAGDCREPHLILEAIADGYHTANAV